MKKWFFINICLIISTSHILYGGQIQPSNQNVSERDIISSENFINIASPFSYNIVKDVTQFHLTGFVSEAVGSGWDVRFLSEIEYNNIVHALEINIAEVLSIGNDLIAYLLGYNPNVLSDIAFNGREILGVYFRDIDASAGTIRSVTFTIRFADGQNEDVLFECDYECNLYVQENMDYSFLRRTLLLHLSRGLFQSFEALLRREDISEDHKLTLYLKDLSETKRNVRVFRDVERINIGVIVEDEDQKFLKEVNWIIEASSLERITRIIRNSVFTPIHEAAHNLLLNLISHPTSQHLEINSHIVFSDGQWFSSFGSFYHNVDFIGTNKDDYLKYIAVALSGSVIELIFNRDNSRSSLEDIEMASSNDYMWALALALEGICSGVPGASDIMMMIGGCPQFDSINDFFVFSNIAPEHPLITQADLWLIQGQFLSLQVFADYYDVLIELVRSSLQKGSLNSQDLQQFYQDHPLKADYHFIFDLNHDVSNSAKDVGRELRNAFIDLSSDILNMNLSFLFSLDIQQNLEKVRRSSIPEILSEVEEIEVPPHLLHFIRKGPKFRNIGFDYAQGLPSLYIRESIRTLLSYI